jgi:hypothetical protein
VRGRNVVSEGKLLQTVTQPTTLKARAWRGHHDDEVAHSETPDHVGAAKVQAYVVCNRLICVMGGSYGMKHFYYADIVVV